jgi:hypothetical protein
MRAAVRRWILALSISMLVVGAFLAAAIRA